MEIDEQYLLKPGTVVDRYTVETTLGQGGMAVVFQVRHNQLGTRHALKILTMPVKSIRDRLLQEGRVQASLRHPNIVAVTDVITVDDAPGLVMEFIGGPALDDFLAHHKLTFEQADVLAQGIISGVASAHTKGLIHRDLKPANVMLDITDAGLVPKVADFGLAKVLSGGDSQTKTRSGVTMGTPAYMSPEQIRDSKNVDQRADIFSLGCILYDLVCGERAFHGGDTLALFTAVANAEFRPPREHVPDLPERMEKAILGALQVDLDKRIPDCKTLLDVWTGRADVGELDAPKKIEGPWTADVIGDAKSLGSEDSFSDSIPTSPEPTSQTFFMGEGTPAPVSRDSSPPSAGRAGASSASMAVSAAPAGSSVPFDTASLAWHAPAEVDESLIQANQAENAVKTAAGNSMGSSFNSQTGSMAPTSSINASSGAVLLGGSMFLFGAVIIVLGIVGVGGLVVMLQPDDVAVTPPTEMPADATTEGDDATADSEEGDETAGDEGDEDTEGDEASEEGDDAEGDEAQDAEGGDAVAEVEPVPQQVTRPPVRKKVVPEPTPQPAVTRPVVVEPDPPPPPEPVAPTGPPPGKGWVQKDGDGRVWLVSSAGRFRPGDDLDPGSYDITVFFDGTSPIQSGSIQVQAGQTHTVVCHARLRICKEKKK